jgi:sugar lactone lactonase YvrE
MFSQCKWRKARRMNPAFPVLSLCWAAFAQHSGNTLTEVYHNDDFQFTGVTVSKTGRMFLNFPRWSDRYVNAVVEVMKDGSLKPYPDESWNQWDMKAETVGKKFICVQSVVADDRDALWVVDAAAPLSAVVVPGGAKLVRIDLGTNQVTRVYSFGPDVAKPDTYLNDVRIDARRNTAYMTDSGAGGIVVVDLTSGSAHRALDGDPSVLPEPGVAIGVDGTPVVAGNGRTPQIASDGIALSRDGEYLYFKALTGNTLYRARTSELRQGGKVMAERIANTFPSDGLWIDGQDRLYLGSINHSTIYRLSKNGNLEKILMDSRLEWPDTFSEGPDGAIYISASRINDSPRFNQGKSTRKLPYSVFRFMP